MTNFIKREHDLIAEFQKEMDGYGLKVDNGTSGRCGEGCYHLEMTTKIERAKGKKALIALLLENGYTVNKFMFTDRKTGERYMAFKVYKYATMEDRDDDADEYVEPQAEAASEEIKPEIGQTYQISCIGTARCVWSSETGATFITDREGTKIVATKLLKRPDGTLTLDTFEVVKEHEEAQPNKEKQKGEWTNTRLLRLKMIEDAREAAYRMNEQYCAGDVGRNHTNCGVLIQALNVLRLLGSEATDAVWENGGLLVCESVTVDGERIYTR